MRALKAIKLLGLVAFAIGISLQTKADAGYRHPPNLPELEKVEFAKWLDAASRRNEDKVFSKAEGNYLNALVASTSPYLRQHAKNPVNWKPWRKEFLQKAQSENKLIFLSIGYSTCHWCHVMKKESFSDVEIAKAINDSYIAIKVDREELPQIDRHYASLLEAVKGSAGWPITAIINSEGLAIYIDSYVPKERLLTLLERVDSTWKSNPEFLLTTAKNISGLIAAPDNESETQISVSTAELLENAKKQVAAQLDGQYGGLKGEVKFPQESLLLYLLDELRRTVDPDLEILVSLQLDNMMNGGLRDHVDGGFHRYATDARWNIPHYEKMLYNQALMAQVYLEAWPVFYDDNYRFMTQETLDFAIAHLYQEGTGFYSALDADFKGEEGGFYLWSQADIDSALNVDGLSSYTFKPSGKALGTKLGILSAPGPRTTEAQTALDKLSKRRHSRGELHRDEKVITGWNGLMIYSLAVASAALNNNEYRDIAVSVANRLWQSRFDKQTGKLFRTSDRTQELFSLEDYAYLSRGFIGLYDVTQNPKWLERARSLYRSATADSATAQALEPPDLGIDSSTNLTDGELLSPKVILQAVEQALEKRTPSTKLYKPDDSTLNLIKSRILESPINRFSSLLYLNNALNGSSRSTRYFGGGAGRLNIACEKKVGNRCASIGLHFSLKEGWHINSNEPLQDYLTPTIIKSEAELTVEYPKHHVLKLGFQGEPLSLFEGEFKIVISKKSGDTTTRTKVKLPLQACNDRICLLPEESVIIF